MSRLPIAKRLKVRLPDGRRSIMPWGCAAPIESLGIAAEQYCGKLGLSLQDYRSPENVWTLNGDDNNGEEVKADYVPCRLTHSKVS